MKKHLLIPLILLVIAFAVSLVFVFSGKTDVGLFTVSEAPEIDEQRAISSAKEALLSVGFPIPPASKPHVSTNSKGQIVVEFQLVKPLEPMERGPDYLARVELDPTTMKPVRLLGP